MADVYPDDANGRVLRGMAAAGADMTTRYDIDFEHLFPDLRAAETFGRSAAGAGRRVVRSEYVGRAGHFWQVRVIVRMVPTHAGITSAERQLAALADSCGGVADGWGVFA